jgi:hypothetical protein
MMFLSLTHEEDHFMKNALICVWLNELVAYCCDI